MFGFTDAIQIMVHASNSRPARTATERSLTPLELDGASGLVNNHSFQLRTRNTTFVDELSLLLDKALALAG